VVIGTLFVMLILISGMLYWPFILNQIITPIAMVAWLLLRIFILSIDQKYYWGAGIFVILVFLFRLLSQESNTVQSGSILAANETNLNIEHWSSLFTVTDDNVHDEKVLKQELIHLLLLLYASKQFTLTSFYLYEALQRGELPVPDHIHKFLFPIELEKPKRSIGRILLSVRTAPRKWIRRWTGRETAEHYRMIDEVLRFIESSVEMNNDDGKFTTNEN
jgi:hypothetical protein